MKIKSLLLYFLMFLTFTTNYAQTSASASGIAVQGIARDANNTAMSEKTISFRFTLYYNDPSPKTIFIENTSITTDAFGVFSHILKVDPSTNANFSNNSIYLKIEDVSSTVTLISDEVFKHVPYAISANNGVPTGSIMPYVGLDAPEGWVICDGRSLTTIDGSDELIKLVGNNVPNLQGRFLKGFGTNVETNVDPIALNSPQNQSRSLKNHKHDEGTLVASYSKVIPDDKNVPTSTTWARHAVKDGETTGTGRTMPAEVTTVLENEDTNHKHTISGETGSAGDTNEVRPSSWGVNYIIKL